jgi:hypothetical protein
MDYAGFSSALSSLRRGPSPAEVAAWLGTGALSGVADAMDRRRQEKIATDRYNQELALRQQYQDAQLAQMQHAADRQDFEDRMNYGYQSADLAGGPIPSTRLPDPTASGASFLVPPPGTRPFAQAPLETAVQPLPPQLVPKWVPGRYQMQAQAKAAQAQASLGLSAARIAELNARIQNETDPDMRALLRREKEAAIAQHEAAAEASRASAAESRERAASVSTDRDNVKAMGPWARVLDLYNKTFPDAVDPLTQTRTPYPNKPSMEEWVKTWPVTMQKRYGITDEVLQAGTQGAPALLSSHAAATAGSAPPANHAYRYYARNAKGDRVGSDDGVTWNPVP